MTRPIDADALKEIMYNEAARKAKVDEVFSPYQVEFEYFDIEEYIDNAPTIEPTELKQNFESAEPSDLISREDVINIIRKASAEKKNNYHGFTEKGLIEYINALPSADRPKEYNLETIADIVRQLGHLDDYIADICDRPQVNSAEKEKSIEQFLTLLTINALSDNQVADRPKGEWIYLETEPYSRCSVCGAYIDDLDDDKYKYCPHCGAKMKGE